jgi:hypothetical protein
MNNKFISCKNRSLINNFETNKTHSHFSHPIHHPSFIIHHSFWALIFCTSLSTCSGCTLQVPAALGAFRFHPAAIGQLNVYGAMQSVIARSAATKQS